MIHKYVIKSPRKTYWDDDQGGWVPAILPGCKFGTPQAVADAWASRLSDGEECRIVRLRRKPRPTYAEKLLAYRITVRREMVREILDIIGKESALGGAPMRWVGLASKIRLLEPAE